MENKMKMRIKDGARVRFSMAGVSPDNFDGRAETVQAVVDHDGKLATVDCLAVEGYYDITFRDGVTFHAVSALHLTVLGDPV
jgi:hypothetical protein